MLRQFESEAGRTSVKDTVVFLGLLVAAVTMGVCSVQDEQRSRRPPADVPAATTTTISHGEIPTLDTP